MARIVDCIYFDVEYLGKKYENVSYSPPSLDQKSVYSGHKINAVATSLDFTLNICFQYCGDYFKYRVYRNNIEIDDIRISNIRFIFIDYISEEDKRQIKYEHKQEVISNLNIILPFIFGILANILLVYLYFWKLNDDNLFSGDDLLKTVILGVWMIEAFILIGAIFKIFDR